MRSSPVGVRRRAAPRGASVANAYGRGPLTARREIASIRRRRHVLPSPLAPADLTGAPLPSRAARWLRSWLVVAGALAVPGTVAAQRASLMVTARVTHGAPTIRAIEPPAQVRYDAQGAAYAARLTLGGDSRVSVAVSVHPAPGAAAPVRVRDASGALQTLAPGGPPVLVVDAAQPSAAAPVDVHYHVGRAARSARGGAVQPAVVYTIWFPGGM